MTGLCKNNISRAVWRPDAMPDSIQESAPEHTPVLLAETLRLLECRPGGRYVDATVGLAGHAAAILDRIQPGGLLIGLDRDEESLAVARLRLAPYAGSVRLLHENFRNLPLVLNNTGIRPVDGILADLGVSSFQLLAPERGFSFQADAMLDMRTDRTQRLTAADLVNSLGEEQLADVIARYGEERHARRIARAIASARRKGPVTRCLQLAEIIRQAVPPRGMPAIHPATRTFQALRIAVNQELEGLDAFLTDAVSFLKTGGRLVVIAFHSLEDRIVKQTFRRLAGYCVCGRPSELCTCPRRPQARLVTPRVIRPSDAEVEMNPRSRSARLRCVERLEDLGPASRAKGSS